MSNEAVQISIAYEQLGMSPEEIAEDRELDLTAVKAALMASSVKYRKDCNAEPLGDSELNFNDEQLARATQTIYEIAVGSDDDNLRLKAAMYLRDDKKGRKEIMKQVHGQQFNILMFNEQMQRVREVAEGAKRKLLREPVNV